MPSKYQNLRNNIKDISKNCKCKCTSPDCASEHWKFGDYYTLLGGEGYCFGLVFMWGQAVLTGGEPTLVNGTLFPKGEATYLQRLEELTREYPTTPGHRLSDTINALMKIRH